MHIGLGLPKIPRWSAMLTGEELGCGEEEEALARGRLEASSPDPVYLQEARRSICSLAVISNRIVNF